jgi:hypothetical protein
VIWSIETTGPNGLRQLGLADRRLFQIGEKFTFSGYPARNGETTPSRSRSSSRTAGRMTLGFGFDTPPPQI